MTGAEIKALLDDLGISTRQLASKLDVPPPVVLAWQKEELFPTKRHVEAMRALRALRARALPEADPPLALPATTEHAPTASTEHAPTASTGHSVSSTGHTPPSPSEPASSMAARADSPATAATPMFEGLADPAFWRLVRKLLAYPALRKEAEEAARRYQDPAGDGPRDAK